jgi:hypothetical protein
MDFAITCPLVRHSLPQIRFLYIGSHVCSTLLSDPPSPERPCASLLLHLHQVVEGTFTPELSNMLGTIGIGGSLAAPPLPHHRTCGSAYGGSVTWAVRAGGSLTCPTAVSPLPGFFRASPYPPLASSAEADWLAHDRHEFRRLLLTITVRAFIRCRTNMPSADFCCEIKASCDALSHVSATHSRSPEVSSTAFRTQSPNLQPVPLMDVDFAIIGPLVRHRMPQIRFLYIDSYVCSTLLSDPTSR